MPSKLIDASPPSPSFLHPERKFSSVAPPKAKPSPSPVYGGPDVPLPDFTAPITFDYESTIQETILPVPVPVKPVQSAPVPVPVKLAPVPLRPVMSAPVSVVVPVSKSA